MLRQPGRAGARGTNKRDAKKPCSQGARKRPEGRSGFELRWACERCDAEALRRGDPEEKVASFRAGAQMQMGRMGRWVTRFVETVHSRANSCSGVGGCCRGAGWIDW
jgi:hypothetical protein